MPLFLVGTVLLFVLDRDRRAGRGSRAAGRPLVTGLLGLPPSTAQILVMGFLRRDYGAAGLFQLAHSGQLTGVQAVVALTVMTLFVPCVANFLMMVRERGLRTGFAILGVITPIAIFTGAGSELCPPCSLAFSSDGTPCRCRRSRGRERAVVVDRGRPRGRRPRRAAAGARRDARRRRHRCCRRFPGVVFLCDQTELAVERVVADAILVRPVEALS